MFICSLYFPGIARSAGGLDLQHGAARPRKRIDQDCARGSRNVLQAVITMAPIRKRGESAPPAAPRFFQGTVPSRKIKTAPKEECGSKNGFLVIGENWGNKNIHEFQ